jgi:hypothetical protein
MAKPSKKWNYKNIAVAPDVHQRVLDIAKANDRKPGAQVKVWSQLCSHPSGQLLKVGHTVVIFGGDTTGMVEQPVNIMQCQHCGALIVSPGDVFSGSARSGSAYFPTGNSGTVAVETGG